MRQKLSTWAGRVVLLCILALIPVFWPRIGNTNVASAQHSSAVTSTSLIPPTTVAIFRPAGSKGPAVAGNCGMGGALSVNRTNAWRCMVGNVIYDPCFSATPHATSVICGAYPGTPYGIKVTLKQPLPTHAPVTGSQAWILELGDGTICSFLTGATFAVKGERANYGCSDQLVVIGTPQTGKVWYAVKAHISSKPSPNGPSADRLYAVSIAQVWM